MTDKKRLEEIVAVVESQKESVRKLSHNDLNWLIEQAERVQELEKANKENYWIAADFKFENLKLEQQNKRYREKINVALALLESVPFRQSKASSAVKHLNKALEESE